MHSGKTEDIISEYFLLFFYFFSVDVEKKVLNIDLTVILWK